MPGLPGGGNPTRFPGCPLCFVKSYQKSPFLTTRGWWTRGVYTSPYPAAANANTLALHTITPAVVIRTVCCHMGSIPYVG